MDPQEAGDRAAQERRGGTRGEKATGGRGEISAGKRGESTIGKRELSQVDREEEAAGTPPKGDARERIGIAEAPEGDRG